MSKKTNTPTNDERILELKNEVTRKKNALGEKPRFNPITNCNFGDVTGARYNLHTLNKDDLQWLAIRLDGYVTSIEHLKLEDVKLSGYAVQDWIDDCMARLQIIHWTNESLKLNQLELRLQELLSHETKTALEVDKLADLLK